MDEEDEEINRLYEASIENHPRMVEECDIKFEQRYGFSLIGSIRRFMEELSKTGDAATLIGLSFLLDDMSIESEEMRRYVKYPRKKE